MQPITSGAAQTCISFAHNAEVWTHSVYNWNGVSNVYILSAPQVVLVGDAQGSVSVYLMKNIPKSISATQVSVCVCVLLCRVLICITVCVCVSCSTTHCHKL